jgi:hypothetical protein
MCLRELLPIRIPSTDISQKGLTAGDNQDSPHSAVFGILCKYDSTDPWGGQRQWGIGGVF